MQIQCSFSIKKVSLLFLNLFLLSSIYANSYSNYLAGIEVGSKGVKLCILNPKIQTPNLSSKIVFDSTINSDFIKFTPNNSDATLGALLSLYNYAEKRYSIEKANIFLAISSGVAQTAERENKMNFISDLIQNIKTSLEDNNLVIDRITVYQESIYTHKSIISKEEYLTSIIIDQGSGNTKGGYFITPTVFNTFNVPWGTKSMNNFVEKNCDTPCDIDEFHSTLKKKLADVSKGDISQAIDKCGITNYNFSILLSGGIVWASATLMSPESYKEKTLEVSYEDFSKFHTKLVKNYEKIIGKEVSPEYIDEKYRIQKIFDRKSLIAGTGLLLKIMEKFESETIKRKYTLIRNNKAGWLPAYIVERAGM